MSIGRKEASRRFDKARRLFDAACMIHYRTHGAIDSAPLLKKSLQEAARLLVELHGATSETYADTARQAQQINGRRLALSPKTSPLPLWRLRRSERIAREHRP